MIEIREKRGWFYFSLISRQKSRTVPFFLAFFICGLWTVDCGLARADDKQWSGNDDAVSWDKDANWFPLGVPVLLDNATVNTQAAGVVISKVSEVFKAESLTLGGRMDSTVTIGNFVYGLIEPVSSADNALYIRKGGEVILQGGGGVVTLKGAFKNSEETIPDEPAFMFRAE